MLTPTEELATLPALKKQKHIWRLLSEDNSADDSSIILSFGDTSLFLTTYRGGSHLPADIYADNQFMKDYLEQQNTFDEGAFIVADGAYSGEENSQIAALDFQKLLDYINSLNNCAPKIETA